MEPKKWIKDDNLIYDKRRFNMYTGGFQLDNGDIRKGMQILFPETIPDNVIVSLMQEIKDMIEQDDRLIVQDIDIH